MASPTINTQIWLALRNHMADLVLTPVLPILWPGRNVDLPSGNALEVTHLVNRPSRQFIGSNEPHDRRGILQIGVLSLPSTNEHAETVVREIAGQVGNHFPTDARLTYADVMVRVYEAPEVGTSFKDDQRGRVVTPVSIRWQSFC